MNKQAYQTIKGDAESLTVINKSKFIGYAGNVETPLAAMEKVMDIKKAYPDASHHCYAYIIGKKKEHIKFSDDGEPGGTAGLPMAEALKNSGLTDILVVVTRYFGGVKLGSGGLVRAYSTSVSETLKSATIVSYEPCDIYLQAIDYDIWAKIEPKIAASGANVLEREYLEKIYLKLGVLPKDYKQIHAIFQDALKTEDVFEYVSTEYVEI